jgi:vacuolar ATPase assembly integral membrane protein VMA21
MATRRIVSSEKTFLEKDDTTDFSPSAGEKSNIAPAVPLYDYSIISYVAAHEFNLLIILPRHVIVKLLSFTLAMVVGPIGTYFLTLNTVFNGTLRELKGPTCDSGRD